MTLGSKIAWDDTVLPFQLDRTDIRGRVVRLDSVLDEMLRQHDYPPEVEALLAEAALLTALIGQAIKLRWKLSLQIRTNGPVRLIATDFFAARDDGRRARMRAYASFDAEGIRPGATAAELLGEGGYFGILIDQGPGTLPYQGITPIAEGSLSRSAETYFAQSEQLPTRFALGFAREGTPKSSHWRGGGIMLQVMPKTAPKDLPEGGSGEGGLLGAGDILSGDAAEDWSRTNMLLDTVEADELVGPDVQPTELLVRLFHEEGPRVFDPQPVAFGCTCSEARVRETLSNFSRAEVAEMTTDEGTLTADCQFCGAHYVLDPDTVGEDAPRKPGGDGDGPADERD
ncbi:MAG: Hsp33 family molecular chaperone HslO [Alphaproteobacteria bacterium]|nr:MAG: Hsp33 family molecular chaperone HslO [Alphaproteobacteria bacterium]